MQVAQLIPEDWSVALLSRFMLNSVRRSLHEGRQTAIAKLISSYDHFTAERDHLQLQSQRITIGDTRLASLTGTLIFRSPSPCPLQTSLLPPAPVHPLPADVTATPSPCSPSPCRPHRYPQPLFTLSLPPTDLTATPPAPVHLLPTDLNATPTPIRLLPSDNTALPIHPLLSPYRSPLFCPAYLPHALVCRYCQTHSWLRTPGCLSLAPWQHPIPCPFFTKLWLKLVLGYFVILVFNGLNVSLPLITAMLLFISGVVTLVISFLKTRILCYFQMAGWCISNVLNLHDVHIP